jgi:hypothetical protein
MRTLFKICWFSLMLPAAANAEELGRLFFTPEERAQLDYNYAREARTDDNARAIELNGIVQMHGGKRTAWINHVPQAVGRSDEKTPESMLVPLPGKNKSAKLKVGQRVLLNPSANPDMTRPDTPTQAVPKP